MPCKTFPVIDLRATGQNIQRLRKERGLTVRDLQSFFGFEQPQAIYKWQNGLSLPTVDNLYALSVLLETSMEEIIVHSSVSQAMTSCEQRAESRCSVLLRGRNKNSDLYASPGVRSIGTGRFLDVFGRQQRRLRLLGTRQTLDHAFTIFALSPAAPRRNRGLRSVC